MNRPILALAVSLLAAPLLASPAAADTPEASPAASQVAPIGSKAPDFTLADTDGKSVSLASLRGKIVVLEWFNPDCPFVKNAHGESGVLRTMGNTWAGKGVAWLAINSSAEGKQGHGLERNTAARTEYAMSYPVLLDPAGKVGRAYGAKTTPHVFVINAEGVLVYKGGVDNAPMGEVQDGSARIAYLQDALEALAAGKPITNAETRSYGCSVKYAAP
jgi:peroxiredoxin